MIYGFSTILSRLLNFLLTPLFVRKFSTSVYGVFVNLYSWASLVNAVLAFGMETTYFRYLQKVEEKDREKVFNNSFLITIVTASLFLITIFYLTTPIASWLSGGKNLDQYIDFVQFFAIILAADALSVIPFAKLRAEGKAVRYGLLKTINILVFIFCNLFLLLWLPNLIVQGGFWADFSSTWFREGWLGNVFVSNLFASIITLILLLPQLVSFRFRFDRALAKSMFWYSFPILIANISFIINEHLDKMMFPKLLPNDIGLRDLGIYGAVAKIAVFLNLFVTAFRLGAEPFFFSYSKNENSRNIYAKIMEYFVIAMVVVMLGICANIEWLKYFIKGDTPDMQASYWSGLFIIPILLFNYVLLGIYMNLSIWYKLSDQTRYALYISSIGAVLTIIFNFLLIPTYSYVGAVICTTITYVAMILLSYSWGQRNYPIPYNITKITIYLLLSVFVAILMFFVFDRNVWLSNLLLVFFVVGVLFMERSNLKQIWSKK